MARTQVTRVVLGATAVLSLAAVVLQLVLVLVGRPPDFVSAEELPTRGTALVRFFSYFTIQSNLLVIVGCGWVALRGEPAGRLWPVLRLNGLVGITVTGLVYATLLGPTLTYAGAAWVANAGLHYVTPVLTLLGWLVVGPRGRISGRVLAWSAVWPAAYIGWTFVHGAVTGWYPYPFIDVTTLGYPVVLRNGLGLAALIVGLGFGSRALDRVLARRRVTAAD